MIAGPTSAPLETGCAPNERRKQRRYQVEVGLAALLYVATLVLSLLTIDEVAGTAKVFVALLPMLGVAAMVGAIVRYVMTVDELQRQTLIVAAAIAAIVVALATMTLGFLENAGVPRISSIYVWPMMALAFGIALPFVRRHFR